MIDMIKDLGNPYEADLNNELIDRTYDKELVEYVINVFKSLESTGFIKMLDDYNIEYDESKIDYYKYITLYYAVHKCDCSSRKLLCKL
jgi:hypothetical protein